MYQFGKRKHDWLWKIKDLQKLKDRHLDQVSDLKSMNKQLQTDLYDKSEEVFTALKENHINVLLQETIILHVWVSQRCQVKVLCVL